MLDGLIKLIERRMAELGYSKFHIDFVRVRDTGAVELEVPAYNEYYWLTAKSTQVPATMSIISDTEVLTPNEAANYANFNFYTLKEFSGLIFIDTNAAAGIDLEFIRCVPEL